MGPSLRPSKPRNCGGEDGHSDRRPIGWLRRWADSRWGDCWQRGLQFSLAVRSRCMPCRRLDLPESWVGFANLNYGDSETYIVQDFLAEDASHRPCSGDSLLSVSFGDCRVRSQQEHISGSWARDEQDHVWCHWTHWNVFFNDSSTAIRFLLR